MSFPWLTTPSPSYAPSAADARLAAQLRELRDRAALLFRLGYTQPQAVARLAAAVAWEHDPPSSAGGPHRRPAELSNDALAELVRATYARRPSGAL